MNIKTNISRMLPYLLPLIIGAVLLTEPPIDPDFGWHYKYGEYVAKTGRLLRNNAFSFTLPDYQWANSYWLSQLIIYLIWHNLGFLVGSFILSLTFMAVVYKTLLKDTRLFSAYIISVLLSTSLIKFTISIRPFLFSSIFFLILVWILLENRKYVKYLPFLFLMWANMHADFVPGLLIFSIYTVQNLFEQLKGGLHLKKRLNTLQPLLLSALVTIINPYGIFLWQTLIRELNINQFNLNTEFISLAPGHGNWLFFSSYLVLGAVALSSYLQRKKLAPWYLLTTVLFLVLSFRAVYFQRIFLITGIFGLKGYITKLDLKTRYLKFSYMVVVLLVLISLEHLSNINSVSWTEKGKYPQKAVEYIKQNLPPGNMINMYSWGGYLIWQLPEYKTFIDGRMSSWRKDSGHFITKDYFAMYYHPVDNRTLINTYLYNYNINWAILSTDSPLSIYLVRELGWNRVFIDDYSVVLTAKQ